MITRIVDGITVTLTLEEEAAQRLEWSNNALTPAQIKSNAIEAVQQAIQLKLDILAQSIGYDDIKSACSYASNAPWMPDTDPNFETCEKFRRQGNYAQNRMSLTWAMCYAYLASVEAGTKPMPTPTEAVAMMPEFVWPD